jgi:hypothetical protein
LRGVVAILIDSMEGKNKNSTIFHEGGVAEFGVSIAIE